MKTILGLDLGTNSIGWALIQQESNSGTILAMGSRIIPMSQDILGKFDNGVSISQTAERTNYRGIRRLRERHLLRRERLHRVLNILGFLPEHYAIQLDFDNHPGQFIKEKEPKISYVVNQETNKAKFLFKKSFEEMLVDFEQHQHELVKDGKKVPYDWTIYYLRKKALSQKIEKEELAWLLLSFNQKRGYYQREDTDREDKSVEICSLKVIDVIIGERDKKSEKTWYEVKLENNLVYKVTSLFSLSDWRGNIKDFIVTKELNPDNTVKKDKQGNEKVRLSILPTFEDIEKMSEKDKHKIYSKIKIKTETEIDNSHKTVGTYIYDTLLQRPNQKINGKLVRVIERRFYHSELEKILITQKKYHPELRDTNLYIKCVQELYENNDAHQNSILHKDFTNLFLNDIIFYHRPLKSKKSLVSNCKFETRTFIDKEGKKQTEPIKGIAKSHPLFQEFRLWQFIQNLKIYQKQKEVTSTVVTLLNEINTTKTETDVDVTKEFLKTEEDYVKLFDWLNSRKEVEQKDFLKYPGFSLKKNAENYRWNYVEDKKYPCNETIAPIKKKLEKVNNVPTDFLTKENGIALWHILYSVEDKNDIQKALNTFAIKHGLNNDFVEQFKKFPPFEKEYGAYSEKAIKKLLPLMRMGKYWNEVEIIRNMPIYQKNIQTVIANIKVKETKLSEDDLKKGKTINSKFLAQLNKLEDAVVSDFKGIEHFLASYLVYGRHSEDSDVLQWTTPRDIANYLKEFKQHSLRNPIVEQVITETLRVVKDIWEYYGSGEENFFDEIHLELGREMKNPADKRKQMTSQINNNENTNLRIKALLIELKSGGDVENVRPYSPMQQEILKIYEEAVLSSEDGNIPDDILKISKQAQPTSSELTKYKLWLQQKYQSPYTGEIIPLHKLFTPAYEIEHIIPQSRYFDDSLSNKTICEAAVNSLKANRTAMKFILDESGRKIENGVKIRTKDQYEKFITENYSNVRSKMKKLLMEEIPEGFIERQLNDSRYISKVVKNLLSNIVRQDNEPEAISKNVVPVTGAITAQMKQDWGLEHIWNELITPRFERLNRLKNSKDFGDINPTTNKFLPQVPLEYQKGFSKKRIDHRHHALDALTIACITKDHVNYLNSINSERKNYSLVARLRETEEIIINGEKRMVAKAFHKPWNTFTEDTKYKLQGIVVSFKQNVRVINKTVNKSLRWEKEQNGDLIKKMIPQTKGQNWAIRKPMHKDTVSGLVKLRFKKIVILSTAIDNWEMIVDRKLRQQIKDLFANGKNKKTILEFFKDLQNKWDQIDISKVEVYYWDKENVASRVNIDDSFNSSKIASITDSGIQTIMLKHLEKFNEEKNGKIIEHPELAFSPDGLDELNKNIAALNNGKLHQPIFKVRTYEPKGNKFNVGEAGHKKDKYVEAAKGTNLFFGIYKDENEKRNYDTLPLNIVIERQKQGLCSVPEINEVGHRLLFSLSPNDLVYLPDKEESENIYSIDFKSLSKDQVNRVYKMVSSSGNQCFFIRHDISTSIVNKMEFSPLNKMEKSIDGIMIKDICIKLKTDRLGNVKPA